MRVSLEREGDGYRPGVTNTPAGTEPEVPWRIIWAAIGSVALAYVAYRTYLALTHVVTLLVVAGFFAIVLNPAVDYVERRARVRRGIATGLVFIVGLGLVTGMLYSFIRPLAEQGSTFANDLPGSVEDAQNGKGAVGDLVKRFNLEDYVKENENRLSDSLSSLGAPALDLARTVFAGVFAAVTILVLLFLMLMEAGTLTTTALNLIPAQHRERVRSVAVDASTAVSGYVFGNLVISVIAGISAWLMLAVLGVPYAGVLGLFVAFTDLIPLVGATLGAVPTIAFAFLHSTGAGIATLVFFIVYQQFENHVLQVSIMSRTVNVNPLTVLISVLVGVQLFGLLGALLAIPAAGIIQVVAVDLYRGGSLPLEPPPPEPAAVDGDEA
jgi:predicted PurR-regulated permease PerM